MKMKKTLNVLAALAAVLSAAALSSCYTSYRKPIAHIGSEGEAVVITATNADADGWQDCSLLPDAALYQSGGKVYVAGERRVVTPYCRRWYWSFGDELSLQSGAPNLKTRLQFVEGAGAIPVYGEVE